MKLSKIVFLPMAAAITLTVYSCKDKNSTDSAVDTMTTTRSTVDTSTAPAPAPAPVQISADDSLTTTVKDAIKDYPAVSATVSNGEVTLTGEVPRKDVPKVMKAVNATHPKKVNNKLTIK